MIQSNFLLVVIIVNQNVELVHKKFEIHWSDGNQSYNQNYLILRNNIGKERKNLREVPVNIIPYIKSSQFFLSNLVLIVVS
jgi:hypothetical protein